MQRSPRRAVVVAVLILVGSLGVVGIAAADGTATNTATATSVAVTGGNVTSPGVTDPQSAIASGQYDTDDSIVVSQEYRLTPDQPGRIDVRWYFEVPRSVSQVWTRLPDDARNVRTVRFVRGEDGRYEWTGEDFSGSITFTRRVNATADGTGPEAIGGRYKFVDAGDWALFQRWSSVPVGYRYRGTDPGVTFRAATAGEGVVGNALVYLGPHDLHRLTAHGQTFRLVVPGAASLAADSREILDSVSAASGRLWVGDRDERVTMVAAPTSVSWGFRGLQTGESAFYVLADERLDTPDNTWLHEYVHTRQDINRTDRTRWFLEASAEYYAAQLTFDQERIDYQAFRDHLERGTRRRFEDVRLIDPATYLNNGGDYVKGALVAGDLDRRLRLSTDGGATFQDVFRGLNRQRTSVEQSDLHGYVLEHGDESVADAARRFTETTATPAPWSRDVHREAFGSFPAVFSYALPDGDGMRVRSSYREGPLGGTGLVTGETLVLEVNVTNVGGQPGAYNLSMTVNGTSVASRTGELDAGVAATVTVEHAFDKAGTYSISTGEDSRSVHVLEPATPVVTDLSADRERIGPGEGVTITATVENPADRPGRRILAVRQNGNDVTSREVRLPPGGTTEVSATVAPPEEGTYRFEAGNRSVSVTVVGPETPTPASSPGPRSGSGSTPATAGSVTPGADGSGGGTETSAGTAGQGFGPVAALLALAALVLVGHRLQ